jgi:hypothetical protein
MKSVIAFLLAWGVLYWACVYVGLNLPLQASDISSVSSVRVLVVPLSGNAAPEIAETYRCKTDRELFCVSVLPQPMQVAYLPREEVRGDEVRNKIDGWNARPAAELSEGKSKDRLWLRSTSRAFGDQVATYEISPDRARLRLLSLQTTSGSLTVLKISVLISLVLTLVFFWGIRALVKTSRRRRSANDLGAIK